MEISKSEFIGWRDSNVTQAYLKDILEQLDDVQAYLIKFAGKDPQEDRRMVGVIQGAQWLIDWQPDFIEDEGEETDA